MEKGYDFPQVTAWIRAKKEDFQLVKDLGIKETGILVSCSNYHVFKKLKMTRKDAIKEYTKIIEASLDAGIIPRADFYRAVVNSTTAWLYGASSVNTALLGIRERTGNTPLESMVMEYIQLRGGDGGMNIKKITEIGECFENELNYKIPPRTPFVGKAFNATRAGIHADGLLKDEEIYNIFDTTEILGRRPVVILDAHSGAAGIAMWLNNYFMTNDDILINKRDERIAKIKEWIDNEYENGRVTAISDSEMEQIVEKYFSELLPIRQEGTG